MTGADRASVVAVSKGGQHRFSKKPCEQITLLEGIGVLGDAHAGVTVQHVHRVAQDPTQPNLRQVHLLPREFFDEAGEEGYEVRPGDLGENVLTQGLDLVALSRDTLLHIGSESVVRITGLRSPCAQIDRFRKGLLKVALAVARTGKSSERRGSWASSRPAASSAPATRSRSSYPRHLTTRSSASEPRTCGGRIKSRSASEPRTRSGAW